ncbi:CoA pyrophosphatase [Vibrio sp. SCSIO 43137]|uniref:CoA pyrophosphatase n=1 Tax=Vibrio sp. SCSIO 43137 TaxID=3021011 RepID=UPI0023071F4A|nr:CoA pyrophosphatase [Vibrio sp. SCSIO 43137]WCE28333.1 CoA pyrophosphatase [Vibrio sp. SCSIO 43137]
MNKTALLTRFNLSLPAQYHRKALKRIAGLDPKTARKAAVLIGFVERNDQLMVVLTRRAKHLRHHPGQVSFPGGKLEQSDLSLVHTAIRETEEEIGIYQQQISVIGQLPELMTVSHFMVTPVVAMINPDYQLSIDSNEVDEVFEVPASHLLDTRQLYSQDFQLKNASHRVFAIPYEHHLIWGVTAQIVQALQRQLSWINNISSI